MDQPVSPQQGETHQIGLFIFVKSQGLEFDFTHAHQKVKPTAQDVKFRQHLKTTTSLSNFHKAETKPCYIQKKIYCLVDLRYLQVTCPHL